jgi:hypothetical protein
MDSTRGSMVSATAFLVFSSLSVLSLASFLFSGFLQMRGVVNDIASRVCLHVSVVLLSGTASSIALSIKRWRVMAKVLALLVS